MSTAPSEQVARDPTRFVREVIDFVGARVVIDALIEAAEADPNMFVTITESDPLALAKLRGIAAQHELVRREGGCLAADEVAEVLGISRQAVDKRRRSGRLLAVSVGRRGYLYPAWQFAGPNVDEGVQRIGEMLGDTDPWSQVRFFVSPNSALESRCPVVALREGDFDAVARAARIWGTHGAT